MTMKYWIGIIAFLFAISCFAKTNPTVVQLNLEGVIHEGTVQTIESALQYAKNQNAQALLIALDTPGGILESTRKIVKLFLNEDFPIIVYVSPTGSRAGSAGTFITLASNIAVMAPGTNMGAAHPVSATGKDPEEGGKHMAEKIENDTVAFMSSIAQQRKRNLDWAKNSVLKSVSIGEVEAKKIGVIDEIASDIPSLLKQINGRVIELPTKKITLQTADAVVVEYQLNLKTKVLNFLAHPTVMMILVSIAGLGLYIEFSHPGMIFPAVASVISIFLLLIASSIIPITAVGVVLLISAFACLFVEIYVTSFGLLTVAGIALFVAGSMLLYDDKSTDLYVPMSIILGIAGGIGIIGTIIAYGVSKTLRQPEIMGDATLIGIKTRLVQAILQDQAGKVFIEGEYWNATSSEDIPEGAQVEIVSVNGLTLNVKLVNQ